MTINNKEKRISQIINSYRESRGLLPLRFDTLVAQVAREHSAAMAEGRVPFGHDDFDRRVERLTEERPNKIVSENIASFNGYPLNEDIVVQFWLKSEKHTRVIQDDYQLTGIGIARNNTRTYFITQIFVRE